MTQTVELSPYLERRETSREGLPAESYVAGWREPNGAAISAEITLPAAIVEQAVLAGARLSICLAPDGRLVLDADGLAEETLEAVNASKVGQQTLQSLIDACLDPELLAGEDDAVGDLTMLRAQLVRALAQVDGTLERLKQR